MVEKHRSEWTTEDKKKANLDNVANDILYKTLDKNMFAKIKTCTTAKEIWEKLTQLCEGNDKTKENKLTNVIQNFDNAKMNPGETLGEFDERFSSIIIELISLEKEYSNREIALKVMRALPREWDVKTIAMRESKDLNKLELHDLFVDLKAYEFELGIRTEEKPFTSQQKKALVATTVTLPVEESTSKKTAELLSNEAMSLFVKEFGKFMRKNQSQMNKPYSKRTILMMVKPALTVERRDILFQNAIGQERRKRNRLTEDKEDKGKWADSESERSTSEESASESEDETTKCLMAKEDPESTEEMVFNFDSIEFTIEDLVTTLHDMINEFKGLSQQFNVAKAKKQDLKNKLTLSSCSQQKEVEGIEEKELEESIWFLDSGCSRHMTGRKSLLSEIINDKGPMINFRDNSKGRAVGKCKIIHGKIIIKDVNKSVQPSRTKEETHQQDAYNFFSMDLFGPIPVMSLGGKKYTLVVIDDTSRFTWVTFLNSKDQTTAQLIKLLKRLQNEKNEAVDKIRSDRRTEFLNQFLSSYLEDHGIKHEMSAARSPQKNGVAERRNRTLKEASRTMLAESSISQRFWAEAINTACYTQNRSMINKNHENTPYDIWTGKKPEVGYFRIFGCKCFIHINGKTQLTAFDVKADNDVFLGYSVVSRAYQVYNQRTLTVEESIHIVFDESSICHDNKGSNIHDLINKLDSTNLEDSSDDNIDLRKTGEHILEQDPTVQEQTQQMNEPEDNYQP
ncbi:uncharacterized protein LOC142532334 [Primulina tabacum]|uniref:uncharacterized protein LOC142532334 n=1 Tax=Primulina tabacum TaxID=48773 RepID=UPI003F59EED4